MQGLTTRSSRALFGLLVFNGLTAVGGGLALMTGWIPEQASWVRATDFPGSYFPGVILMAVVGGSALVAAIEHGQPGETYCIGGRSEQRNLDVVQTICDLLDQRLPGARPRRELIRFVTDRPGHDQRYAIDPAKAERELGWGQQESFESGIAGTIDWYLANDW